MRQKRPTIEQKRPTRPTLEAKEAYYRAKETYEAYYRGKGDLCSLKNLTKCFKIGEKKRDYIA